MILADNDFVVSHGRFFGFDIQLATQGGFAVELGHLKVTLVYLEQLGS